MRSTYGSSAFAVWIDALSRITTIGFFTRSIKAMRKPNYAPRTANVDNGKPKLAVDDFWGAFNAFGRQDEDQGLGSLASP